MTEQTQQIIDLAMQLPYEERAAIIESLWASAPLADVDHGPTEPADEVADAWNEEIQRRVHDMQSGHVKGIPHEEAWRRITGQND